MHYIGGICMNCYINEIIFDGKVIEGKKAEDLIFREPYVDTDKVIRFKSVNYLEKLTGYHAYVDEKERALCVQHGKDNPRMVLPMETRQEEYLKLLQFKKEVLNDVTALWKNIINGAEVLTFFNLQTGEMPFLLTTQSVMNNDKYSPKYKQAVVYAITKAFEENGLKVETSGDFYQMQLNLGRIISDLVAQGELKCEPWNDGKEEVVNTTLSMLLDKLTKQEAC